MILGSMHVHEDVNACECDSIEFSPITASRETISKRHPSSFPFVPVGNQFDILWVDLEGNVEISALSKVEMNSGYKLRVWSVRSLCKLVGCDVDAHMSLYS